MDISNLISFAMYFFTAISLLVIFKFVYVLITPHDEWKLIKEEQNTAAAIGLGGAILGFSLALAGSISNSVSYVDCIIWSVVALAAQSLAFVMVRFIFMPKIVERIEKNEVSAGIMMAVVNVSVGVLNAACMTY